MLEWLNETSAGLDIKVRAVPGAAKNEIQGLYDGALKIRLTTAPVDGKANRALIRFLSQILHIPKTHMALMQGKTSRRKTLRIYNLTKKQFLERISL